MLSLPPEKYSDLLLNIFDSFFKRFLIFFYQLEEQRLQNPFYSNFKSILLRVHVMASGNTETFIRMPHTL